MKQFRVARNIVPLGEFKTHASQVLRELKESQCPVVITQNGRPAAVLVSPEEFDQFSERVRFMSAVKEGLADAKAKRTISDEDLERKLDPEFGALKHKGK